MERCEILQRKHYEASTDGRGGRNQASRVASLAEMDEIREETR